MHLFLRELFTRQPAVAVWLISWLLIVMTIASVATMLGGVQRCQKHHAECVGLRVAGNAQ